MREDGFYNLHSPSEDRPTLAYLYTNPDNMVRGFGFNISDGGGFLPESDVLKSTKVTRVKLTEVLPPSPLDTMADPESAEIIHGVNVFSEWMSKRMLHKQDKGFEGWQNPQHFKIKDRLLAKAAKIHAADKADHKDLIDLANFAMMVFMADWKKTFPFEHKPS